MVPKERINAVLRGLPYDRLPVTPIFMAWAAHFVGASYRDYYLDGDVLVRAQLAVVKEFDLDQISAISDPWREASDFGMQFDWPEQGVGKPRRYLLQTPEDIEKLKPVSIRDSRRMLQRVQSIEAMSAAVGRTHSVLGWVEGPFAEYADLRGVERSLMDLMDSPQLFEKAGQVILQNAVDFAIAQLGAGADMIGIGDAAASLIGPDLYRRFALPFEKRLIEAVHEAGGYAKLHICGNINSIMADMVETGADIIDIDWMVPLDKARQKVGPDVVLCGNVDPSGVLLQGTPDQISRAARDCVTKGGRRFILMPGCEVPQKTPIENIRAFCQARFFK
jgi:MtaA/CmuA family methyltransferase